MLRWDEPPTLEASKKGGILGLMLAPTGAPPGYFWAIWKRNGKTLQVYAPFNTNIVNPETNTVMFAWRVEGDKRDVVPAETQEQRDACWDWLAEN